MKKIILIFIITITCIIIISCGEKPDQSIILKKTINQFYDAIENGDGEKRADMFTKNAMMMPNHWKLVQGKSAIRDVILSGTRMVFKIKDLDRLELSKSDSMAYSVNSYFYTYHPEGQEPVWHKTKNVHIWKLQTDGSWKLHLDIWNSDEPLQE